MDSISFIKYPFHKNNRCSEGILKEKKKKLQWNLEKLNPNILCKFMRFFSLFFIKQIFFDLWDTAIYRLITFPLMNCSVLFMIFGKLSNGLVFQ